jgi:hypothetical protein
VSGRAVVLSRRALQRYGERVRPDLSAAEAAAELRERARRGRVWRRRPTWLAMGAKPTNAAGFLVLVGDPEVVLPLVINEDGAVVATTAKARLPVGRPVETERTAA